MRGRRLVLSFVLVFTAGALCGAAGTALYVRSVVRSMVEGGPLAVRRLLTEGLAQRLDLSAEQIREIAPIVAEIHETMLKNRRRFQPEMEATLREGAARIRPILSEPQQRELDKLLELYQRRWRVPDRK